MTTNQPTPRQLLDAYLAASRPPTDWTTGQILAAIRAWNAIAAEPQPQPEAPTP